MFAHNINKYDIIYNGADVIHNDILSMGYKNGFFFSDKSHRI